MKRSDFAYELPTALIAQHPPAERAGGRLLHLPAQGAPADRRVAELPALLRPGDLLIANDTRVVPARLFATKSSGGRAEILVERVLDTDRLLAQVRASKTPRDGSELVVDGTGVRLRVEGREGEFYRLHASGMPVAELLERAGRLPLPPYIGRDPDALDAERYQTVFAREPGAVAAPTAGLHFTPELLGQLRDRGVRLATVTLHVGAGTFQPVRVEDLATHRMHPERYVIPDTLPGAVAECRAAGGRVVAVGTTVVRALESAAAHDGLRAGPAETRLFITPGFRFRVTDVLLTNFHLPESTLLMLVCAFGGQERVLSAYRHAVQRQYRFFSYGDAMLVEPGTHAL
ncbi:MAG TPA: tRNA preQ1(34) S-adenosylmethionine ribosyltransferase-isomerase QueA [Candidatus Binatia bacterium]|nr:tRNA preQ1(34) S-adenosylmethionine ribosyltransferase-isomerase QueA [Candidatus Binatia bacterium]